MRTYLIVALAGILLWGCSRENSDYSMAALSNSERATQVPAEIPHKSPGSAPGVNLNVNPKIAAGFMVYTSKEGKNNHFTPSGWMGDVGDVTMDDNFKSNCKSPEGCVKFSYSAKKTQGNGWAGVYWLNPPTNWGNQSGGYNLKGANRLTFWARGEKGGEKIGKFIVGGVTGQYSDSVKVEHGPITLSNTWQMYAIELDGQDLSYVSGGFAWTTSADLNPEGATFYFDQIKFE